MNPAVLVLLWIRLSVTFGYPAPLTISTIFGDTPAYKDSSRPWLDILATTPTSDEDTQIISIVRVQSTSMVKPKIVVNKSNEISISMKKPNSAIPDNVVTPYAALLRKNRLDVEDRETYKIASHSSTINYHTTYKVKFQYGDTPNDTTEHYDDVTEPKKTDYDYETSESDNQPEHVYGAELHSVPEQVYSEPEKIHGEPEKMYSEPEKIYGEPERVYNEPEKIYGQPERVYNEPEKIYGQPERVYGEPEKIYQEPEKNYEESEKLENDFKIPDSADKSYSLATQISDKKSSYIVDNGTYRKYRVEQKTPDGFIVGEYGMVSHRDGSLRGVRYTADSNINPSLIYETLVKFLSLK